MSFPQLSPFQPFLNRLLSRSALDATEQRAILDLPGNPAQVQTNRDFVRLGERVDHACFVIEGLVGRFGQNSNGNRQITAVHIPTDMVDLHSVVEPRASSALQALAVTTILRVPHGALRAIARLYPAIAEAFWRECVLDAAVLSEWVVNVGRRDSRSRAAHLICEMASRTRSARGNSFAFTFPATQVHMADMLGLTSVHVNRVLHRLRRDKVVTIHAHNVHVLDWSRLMTIGDFDPHYLHIMKLPGLPEEALQPVERTRRTAGGG